MRIPVLIVAAAAAVLASCGSQSKPASAPVKQAETPKPPDESYLFPDANKVDSKVVDMQLLGKSFMPGGTLVHYKKGKTEYDMFAARMPSGNDAAILLLDWKDALADSKLIPHFGGYFGLDAGRPVFVFAKASWIAGVSGLPEKDADMQSRFLAARLN